MRIQKINDYTLRIFLSFSELAEKDITMADLFQRSAKTEQLFWDMIAKAGEEVQFVLDKPFWIQATVMSGDEFVITVVKQDYEEEVIEEPKPKAKRKLRSKEWVFRFDDWDQLVNAAKALKEYTPNKTSIYHYQANYFLVINSRALTGPPRQKAEAILKEFGEKVNVTKVFLEEYGTLVKGDNALETVLEYF